MAPCRTPGTITPSSCVTTGPDPQETPASANAPQEDGLDGPTHSSPSSTAEHHTCPRRQVRTPTLPCSSPFSLVGTMPGLEVTCPVASLLPTVRVSARLCPSRQHFLLIILNSAEMSLSRKPSLVPARRVPLPCTSGYPTAWP